MLGRAPSPDATAGRGGCTTLSHTRGMLGSPPAVGVATCYDMSRYVIDGSEAMVMHGMHGGGWRGGGPRGPWMWGPPFGPGGGPRARRGNVRAAILALLAERPMHGY